MKYNIPTDTPFMKDLKRGLLISAVIAVAYLLYRLIRIGEHEKKRFG